MKAKQERQQREAGKAAIEAYLDSLIDDCHVKDTTWACPTCVRAYEHTLTYYRKTFRETT